ncbi:MAG: hypothetical protein ACQCN5_05190 [Candidatus Bathyarchaeia archaeon]|jgi:hypothetical protein
MSSQVTVKETDLPFNQAIELQKIQILDGYCQTKLNAQYSLFTGGFVGLIILYATLYYQGSFDFLNNPIYVNTFFVTLLVLTSYAFKKALDRIVKMHDELLNKLNGFLVEVENGRKLQSISKLKKELAK